MIFRASRTAPIVRCVNHKRIIIDSQSLQRIEDTPHVEIHFLDRVSVFAKLRRSLETLAHAKIGLIKRFLWMECVIEGMELQLAAGKQIDIGSYTQLTNTWLGIARLLGLERKSRPVRRLHEHLMEAS